MLCEVQEMQHGTQLSPAREFHRNFLCSAISIFQVKTWRNCSKWAHKIHNKKYLRQLKINTTLKRLVFEWGRSTCCRESHMRILRTRFVLRVETNKPTVFFLGIYAVWIDIKHFVCHYPKWTEAKSNRPFI